MQAKTLFIFVSLVALAVTAPVARADPYQREDWNNPAAPENGENYWAYWDENYSIPDEPPEANYHHHPMPWSPTGGVGDSGYVWTPLAEMESHHDEVRAHWPAYLTDQIADHFEVAHREIDLSIDNAHISLAVKDRGTAITPVNLEGGQIYFFIGQWWLNNEADPDDDQWIFFYNANANYDFNALNWTVTSVPVGTGTTDWPVIAQSGVGNSYPLPPVSNAWELFVSPQQWGVVIYDPAATVLDQPSGELGFDNFAIIPEPYTIVLIGMAAVCLLLARWRRKLL